MQVPVVASSGHVDVTRHDHPWRAGQGGPRGNRVASRLTREADVIVVLGARLGFNSKFYTSEFVNFKACIAHVDIDDSAAGRYSPVEIAVQADAFQSAQVLMKTPASDVDPWREAFAADMTSLVADRADEAEITTLSIHPKRVLVEIREALPEEVIVTLDTGNTCLQAGDRLARYQSPDLVTP
ncbi:hypothetical protein [Roseobacter sp.]|uniref:hypothetical protein n=1 Tax=Roseobacter sp. TaxID=1907202 RepID=UPI00385CE936